MAHIRRKYIDSHWLIFLIQGGVAMIFGWLALFTGSSETGWLVSVTSMFLLGLGLIELCNALIRKRHQHGSLVSLVVAAVDIGAGIALMLTLSQNVIWHLTIIAGYTIFRGIFEIIMGFRSTVDPTDRFIWVLCGVVAAIMGFAILNSGHLETVNFIRFFGAYMLVFGTGSMIYGVHNRSQKIEDHDARVEDAKNRKKVAKKQPKRK